MATIERKPSRVSAPESGSNQFEGLVVASSAGTPEERAERVRRATTRNLRGGVRVTKAMYRPSQ